MVLNRGKSFLNAMDPVLIYHITHINNLESILLKGGLLCVNEINITKSPVSIAHQSIQDQRAEFKVPVSPYGCLHDYVPFYFAPRSPMLYTINRGNVMGYNEGQGPIIYLVTNVNEIANKSIPYCFTDGHGIMHFTAYYEDLRDLKEIDWAIMKEKYWGDTPEDPDRKRRRQAEFLVYNFVPIECIQKICVINNKYKTKIQQILSEKKVEIPVNIESSWYY